MEETAAGAERSEPGDSEQDEEDDVYEVERIIDMRMEKGKVMYRVRWKNYTSDDDTWEPEAHLADCREVLLAYRRKVPESKTTKESPVVEEARAVGSSAVQERQLAVASGGIEGTQEEEEQVEVTASGLQRDLSPKVSAPSPAPYPPMLYLPDGWWETPRLCVTCTAGKELSEKLPLKSDLFDADSESDTDNRETLSPKKKKKCLAEEEEQDDFSPDMHKKNKKKEKKKWKQDKVLPGPESDRTESEDEDNTSTPAPPRTQKISESKRAMESEDDEEAVITSKKQKKDKPKEGGKHKKDRAKDARKHKKGGGEGKKRKDYWNMLDSSSEENELAAALEELSDTMESPSMQTDAKKTEKAVKSADKPHSTEKEEAATSKGKQKQSKPGLKLQGIRDLIQEKKGKKPQAAPSQKESTHQKLKKLMNSKSLSKTPRSSTEEDPSRPSSDSSDAIISAKRKGKAQETAIQRESTSPSSSYSAAVTKEDEGEAVSGAKGKTSCSGRQEDSVEKDQTTSTNLFEKFLLNCEAKDRVPRRQITHPNLVPESKVEQTKTTTPKTAEKTQKKTKTLKESLPQKPEPDRTEKAKKETKIPEAPRPAQSPTQLEIEEKQEKTEKADTQGIKKERSDSQAERQERTDSQSEKKEKTDNQADEEKAEEAAESRVTEEPREKAGEAQERRERGEQRDRRERLEDTQGGRGERRAAEVASPELADETAATGRMKEKKRRRENSEPRLYIACEDNHDPQDMLGHTNRNLAKELTPTERGQTSLNLDLKLDWMTLEDFQKHLNGDDEILSAATISPSELRDAVKSGDYLAVKLALSSKEDYNLDQEDSSGMSLTMLAAAGGQDDILRLLIKKGAGAYVNAQTLGGETALMKACKRGNVDVVRLLLEHGADCNILSKHQINALHFAKLSNNVMVYDHVKDHLSTLSSVAEETIRAYFETRLALLEPVFPLACHRLCEGPDFSLEFNYKPPPHSPVEGSGILLFIFHANFLSEITARLCGPCSVHAVVLNDKFQLPIFLGQVSQHPDGSLSEDSHFIYSFSPVQGTNKLFIRLAEAPTAKVKLLICAYRVQLQ
ncbi:hypothetical protein JZ751_028167 [Albula glossodonta]|uniref:Chromo domain-containing protein n=1 Tax=Albula glossodonta TaxID=121402 RepID=A0A8T2PBV8_9TELE|nr:hypothetical protein JZ751_028167 [Albula glossodonta]